MKSYQEVDFGTRVGFVCGVIALAMFVVAGGCSSAPEPKNRVPTVQAQLDQAQQAVKDAQAAAASAQQTQKDIQASIDKLNSEGRNSDGQLREGHPEQSGVGVVVSFGNAKIPADSNLGESDQYFLDFTFAQRDGFTKRFFPVCPSQTVQAYKPIILMYHWQSYSSNQRGCYVIDGQQAQ